MALAHSPRIVTDGLVLCLDAGNTKSYPGSGTTWSDLSGNGRYGTLNGVGYNSGNGGSLTFDGTDDYVDCGTFFNYQTFTISLWLNCGTTQTTYANIFDNNHTGDQNFVFQQNESDLNQYAFGVLDGSGASLSVSGTIVFTASTWYNVAFTFSPSSRVIAYVNGEFHSQGNLANGGTINYVNQSLALGRWQWAGTRHWNGKISDFMIYDTVLSAEQVQQNFNALRGRYGI